jgi:hypothetical protein
MARKPGFKRRFFTLVEILTVIAVISLLAGLLLPNLVRAKVRAKEARWLAFNSHVNSDGDTVLNYNFMYDDYNARGDSGLAPALRNGAVGCTVDGFDARYYDGLIKGSYEWRKGAGRWSGLNNALQFDGDSTYIDIPGGGRLSNCLPATPDAESRLIFCQ